VRAARVPVAGRERVAKFIAALSSRFWKGVTLTWVDANGQASMLISRNGEGVGLVTTDASDQGIHQMVLRRPVETATDKMNIASASATDVSFSSTRGGGLFRGKEETHRSSL
jgi:hypothetical protein